MRVVNPIGRKTATKATALRACYCGTVYADFGAARNDTWHGGDDCIHCGCDCDLIPGTGTYMHAQATFRTS